MQPILILAASAVGLAITLWAGRIIQRSIFRSKVVNELGFFLVVVGMVLLILRSVLLAVPLMIIGTVLLLRKNVRTASGPRTQTSKVRTAHLEMTLDHETGTIGGRILSGKLQGQALSSLTLHELLTYHAEIQMDEESVKLIETFLESAHPDWRDQENENSNCGEKTSSPSTKLSRDEAYELLGLEAGCSEADIRSAYHRLIKRVHPDTGGSAALTAQITKARDRLLGDRQ